MESVIQLVAMSFVCVEVFVKLVVSVVVFVGVDWLQIVQELGRL